MLWKRLRVPLLLMVAWPLPVMAQTIQGRVLDEGSDEPVGTALVRLVDAGGEERALTAADGLGAYRLEAPGPGVYRIEAERIGYQVFATPLIEMLDPAGVYPVDLLMSRAPVPIRGLEVTAEDVDLTVRRMIGVSIRSLRADPVREAEILSHAERAHDLTAMMRWQNHPGIEVQDNLDGPCFFMRRRGSCMPVYLNGFRMPAELTSVIPLDMVYTMVVVFPLETIVYPGGGILLYTKAWLR